MDKGLGAERSIVVGVDGSASAARALSWASREAVDTGSVLRIVNVWSVPVGSWGVTVGAYIDPVDIEEGARQIVRRALRDVRRDLGLGAPQTELLTMPGATAERLLDVAAGATMLVVGSRGRGGFASLLLGSVAMACAHHTVVPLVVVGGDEPEHRDGAVVVGLDDSAGGRTALRWAAAHAAASGVPLRVVHGWDLPVALAGGLPTFGPMDEPHQPNAVARRIEEVIATDLADLPTRPATTVVSAALSAPEALLQEAKNASLLVVGSRGRGGFLGLLLGSVSQQCVQHSPCPVVVVPTTTLPPS